MFSGALRLCSHRHQHCMKKTKPPHSFHWCIGIPMTSQPCFCPRHQNIMWQDACIRMSLLFDCVLWTRQNLGWRPNTLRVNAFPVFPVCGIMVSERTNMNLILFSKYHRQIYLQTTRQLHNLEPDQVNRKCSVQQCDPHLLAFFFFFSSCTSPPLLLTSTMKSLPSLVLFVICPSSLSQSSNPPRGLSSCARTPRRRCWQLEWLWGSWGWCRDTGRVHLHERWCIWTGLPWSAWVYPQLWLKEEEWWRSQRLL